ncbi:phospholipase A2 inhibitor gamma subunit B-like [Pelobates fuscus]|uniref:phospholipase A2 inhibitor gamma subunit B-like n=1 Tax=Pelobates fuscus TaxID=191477 RepID=UPI002FE44392
MHGLLITICLFSALLAPVHSKTCAKCFAPDQNECVGEKTSCVTEDQVCISVYQEITTADSSTQIKFARGCGKKSECDISGSYSYLHEKVRVSTTCCPTDGCTPKFPELAPAGSSQKNGVSCPFCVSEDSDCSSDITWDCTGNEDRCFLAKHTTTGIHVTQIAWGIKSSFD